MVGDLRDPLTALEAKYGLLLPVQIYPLFENSFRYSEGLSIEANRNELGEFCSKLSAIASENPNAWFKNFKTKEEIMNPGPGNRMISFPYTKFMCSIMDVDQAAALFLADEAVADELGIPPEKRIYPIGGADASDTWHVSMRRDLHASPSVKIAAQTAMAQAKVDIDQIDFLDFYSCFPCAPRITARMLGIPKDDLISGGRGTTIRCTQSATWRTCSGGSLRRSGWSRRSAGLSASTRWAFIPAFRGRKNGFHRPQIATKIDWSLLKA
ncbi:MAG: hypothetical protein JRJ16_03890, partial [Deltaproteobacteria bacterium]|nr:hypothetical protein [Deltaproteobacteria bacterium]